MPTATLPIEISFDGNTLGPSDDDGKTGVVYAGTKFHAETNASPGAFEMVVRDPNLHYSGLFKTGKEVRLTVGGVGVWGGYAMSVSRKSFFPDVVVPQWVIRGPDYNIAWDKRVARNPANYLAAFPDISGDTMDGDALTFFLANYTDMGEFDSSGIKNIRPVAFDTSNKWAYVQQGSKVRDQFEDLKQNSAAAYWIDGDKVIHYVGNEDIVSEWGFSLTPDGDVWFPFRDVEATEDGSVIVNDALIWGGSEFTGAAGGTLFSRYEDSGSESLHGRWQLAETHFGEVGFDQQHGVDDRAHTVIDGPPGADANNVLKGLKNPQWLVDATWFHHRVPNFAQPGVLFPITLPVFSQSYVLPLRTIDIDFPTIDDEGGAVVRYRGTFAITPNDPRYLWDLMRKMQYRKVRPHLGGVKDASTRTVFGAYGSLHPTHVSGLVYKTKFGYVPGTLSVFDNGLLLTPDLDWHETDPVKGTFTLEHSPAGTLYATSRTLNT